MDTRRGLSDINALEMLGGYKKSETINRIQLFYLVNHEKVVVKYSKISSDGKKYWFGITPNAIKVYKSERISHITFILGYEGIVKLPIEILYKYIQEANVTKNKDGGIKRYHINISFSSDLLLYNSIDSFVLNDYYIYDEEIVEDELGEKKRDIILEEAKNFIDYKEHYVKIDDKAKRRKESSAQKKRIAILEDHTCQVCGFKEEYIKANNKKGWIIEVDHIIEKSKGGGETFDNLWVLCPNCHAKKTRGIIEIDSLKKVVKEKGESIRIRDNHLGWGT
ncbi:HNH endonuclease [Bacillus cereus]|uniref:DNA helicase, putative n=1 Tax=Bacillus cereus (strain AH820) TaxID=405535 RepID=B7JSJ9_BACC0|nr:HNH endonuclease signature motif containing protein [Bacillus cereus]ACK88606.1 DNA helicase, putative [Bacillus cereus AH820]MCQ0952984.1 HNH endonuclease [Bacillus cereus]MDA1611199.1 HNH endonuclease signature motif containing protein [Bacillus cereus]MDV6363000.1 HNH endonuclease signature motif containing protein [Bacillus cereus]